MVVCSVVFLTRGVDLPMRLQLAAAEVRLKNVSEKSYLNEVKCAGRRCTVGTSGMVLEGAIKRSFPEHRGSNHPIACTVCNSSHDRCSVIWGICNLSLCAFLVLIEQ